MKKCIVLACIICVNLCYAQRSPAVDSLLKITDSAVLKNKLASLEKGTEEDLTTLVSYYRAKSNDEKVEAIAATGARRFPQGSFALQRAQKTVTEEQDAAKRKKKFLDLRKRFPALLEKRQFQMLAADLADQSVENKSLADATFYSNYISDPGEFSWVAGRIASLNAGKAEELLKKYVAKHTEQAGNPGYNYLLTAYVHVLVQNGKPKDAEPYARQAYVAVKESQEFIKDYVSILRAEGNDQEVVNVLEAAFLDGLGSAEIQQALSDAYQKTGKDAAASLTKLKTEFKEKVREEVAKQMMNTPAPQFVVKDVNGTNVSLSDFKGKTIVVDFWATWCGPCKASFPTMQKLVNKYKDNKDIRFLFVHTLERGIKTPLEAARTYLAKNNYRFDLYMDYMDPETKTNPAVSAFDVPGIPTKFVIDGNGTIRFKSVGFYVGKEAAAIEELSAMIEMAKAGTTPAANSH